MENFPSVVLTRPTQFGPYPTNPMVCSELAALRIWLMPWSPSTCILLVLSKLYSHRHSQSPCLPHTLSRPTGLRRSIEGSPHGSQAALSTKQQTKQVTKQA